MSTDVEHYSQTAEDDPAATPDPAYVARERELLAVLCQLYGAGNVHCLDAADGDLLIQHPIFPAREPATLTPRRHS